ncbi:MAG: response regulator [Methanolinea sp.]|nr:response regulator [Methanolinea sp.]
MITVLFVDDEPALLDVSRLYLEKTGDLKVDLCYSAEQALERLRERSYDVVVSDYEMPGMDGISFLKVLRRIGDQTPFIIFTGKGREHVVIEALNNGADFYLQKGGDPRSQFTELIHKIRVAVERFQKEGALQVTRHSVEKAGIPIFWVDVRGRIIYANESAGKILGYSPDELRLLSMSSLDPFFSPQEWSLFAERLKLHLTMTVHMVFRTQRAENVPAAVVFSHGDVGGRDLIFAYAFPRALSAAAEPLLEVVTSQCHALADSLSCLYLELTTAGEIIFLNGAASAFLGKTLTDPGERRYTIFEITARGQHQWLGEVLSRVVGPKETDLLELSFIRHDGVPCTFLFRRGVCSGPRGLGASYLLEIPQSP